MKKPKSLISLLIVIIAFFVGSETVLDIDLLEWFTPEDSTPPVIDASNLRTTVVQNSLFTTDDISCSDNIDDTCTIVVDQEIDTSIIGSQRLIVSATDSNENTSELEIIISIIEGVIPSMYIPDGYYDGIDGLEGDALKNLLNDIITSHTEYPYTDDDTDVWDILRAADEDPDNPDNVILFYTGQSVPKDCQDTRTDLLPDFCFEDENRDNDYIEWNREHIWSKSHGDFEDEDGYAFKDEDGGYALGAHTDAHHLVASERSMNSTKNNRFYDDCHDGIDDDNLVERDYGNYTCGEWFFEPRDEVKGDVARMLFYMAVRYEGEDGDFVDLELTVDLYDFEDPEVSIKNSKLPYYEDLAVLLRWHEEDPVSEWEILRNQTVYGFQGNRNPFIDMPDLVSLIWGTYTDYIN